jgi:hypothetical protein
VALGLFGLLTIGIIGTWSKAQEAYFVGSEVAEVEQNARSAIDFMVRELRSTGRDVTDCAFDFATSATFTGSDCNTVRRDACRLKLNGNAAATTPFNDCANVFAIFFGTATGVSDPAAVPSPTAIQIRADRNDNGTIAGTTNSNASDPGSENVFYRLMPAGSCPGGIPGACVIRDDGTGPTAMVGVDVSGLTFTSFPTPGYPPCSVPNAPPPVPCPSFVPADQADADHIGRIRISITTAQTVVGQQITKTFETDVILRNRN